MSVRLGYLDQAAHLSMRATGRRQLVQLGWLYRRPVDPEGIARFHRNFGRGLAGRRIERSPLPFGRHRWVAAPDPAPLKFSEIVRPGEELGDWFDERSQIPVDPEHGPGWHMAVQPFSAGATAVTVVGSHCLLDGVAVLTAAAHAADDRAEPMDWPPPRSRSPVRAVLADLAQTCRDIPDLVAAARAGLRGIGGEPGDRTGVVVEAADGDRLVRVPALNVFVSARAWDEVAARFGGNGYSLLAGLAAELGRRMRRCGDGRAAELLIALSERTVGDTRANALRMATVRVDPATVTTDLTATRTAIRAAVADARTTGDGMFAMLPLAPFVPLRVARRLGAAMFGSQPISCSNLGELDPAVCRPDGTPADSLFLRPVDQNVREHEITTGGGQLVVVAGRVGGVVTIGIVGYTPGGDNTRAGLRALVDAALGAFGLIGEFV
ncbi:hypothetical protein MINS_24750 [Mycolicibacterium insubricum]|jgi:hypothetical protein|uniref:Uncharacterized protein n=2 Tax=Mycolicibacterium insubricum TaxID=444597 RepID=A0A1X0DF66_9MYCO|nr:hypothetical protein [Mycolicibacterium insubricum]ORA71033.1 hypothetical protein BST26_09130 [Mycolicibacterium insubricum]BBZ67046.1 hypothetical protein MINS_24750 [Mycolicibacterium insubricum]